MKYPIKKQPDLIRWLRIFYKPGKFKMGMLPLKGSSFPLTLRKVGAVFLALFGIRTRKLSISI